MTDLTGKLEHLRHILTQSGRLAVAFSGGVDSAFLIRVARDLLPEDRLLAVTARSVLFPQWETREALELARSLNVPHLMLDIDALAVPEVSANPPDRCYFCKRTLFGGILAQARARGFEAVADGGNLDDLDDYRPGARAVRELGVLSPLREAGLGKTEIRRLSAEMGLGTWNKPAYACLASRIPYGQPLTKETLERVEKAEDLLLSLGFRELRVRCHDRLARLEVGPEERPRFFDAQLMDRVHRELSALGFSFVTLDLAGYRSGSLNLDIGESDLIKYAQER